MSLDADLGINARNTKLAPMGRPGGSVNVHEVTLKQLLDEKRKLVKVEKENVNTSKLWVCALLLDEEIKKRKKMGEKLVDTGFGKSKGKGKGKEGKGKKRTIGKRLKEAFSFHTKSFRKTGSKYQIASADDGGGYGSDKVTSREFTDEDCEVIDAEGSSLDLLQLTPKKPTVDDSVPSPKSEAWKEPAKEETKNLSPKYPAIAASEEMWKKRQQQLNEANREMKLADEFLKLFWRLNKSLNVLVYTNNHGAICIQVYNKYTGKTYNKLFCTEKAILEAMEKAEKSETKISKRNSGTRSESLVGVAEYVSKEIVSDPKNSSEMRHHEAVARAKKLILLADALKEYLRSDNLQLVKAENGDAGDDMYVLSLKGVDTVGTGEELASKAGIPIPGEKMQSGGVMLTRTMTECKRIAETLSQDLGKSFDNLSEGNQRAEDMVIKTTEMIAQLEAATKLLGIKEGSEGGEGGEAG